MTCQEIRENLSAYLDRALDATAMKKINEHLAECSSCQHELADLRFTIQLVRDLPEVEAPAHFHESLMERLAKEIDSRKTFEPQVEQMESYEKTKKGKAKYWLPTVAVAAVLFIAVAVGQLAGQLNIPNFNMGATQSSDGASRHMALDAGYAGNSKENKIAFGDAAPAAMPEAADLMRGEMGLIESDQANSVVATAGEEGLQFQQRIIKDAFIRLEVSSFQQAAAEAEAIVVRAGGYIQDSNVSAMRDGMLTGGELTLRVPQERFEATINDLEQLGKLKNKGLNGHNVTMEYIDIEGRLKVTREKEQRLLSLLEKAERLEDVLNIERELGYARSEIEYMVGRIRYLDHATSLSTIRISLAEVEMATDRISAPGIGGIFQDAAAAFILTTNKLLRMLGDAVVYGGASLPIIGILVIAILIGLRVKNYYKKK